MPSRHAYAPRILIVEDESDVRLLFERVLAQHVYYVTSVATGGHALFLLRETTFDMIIVDMSLPDRDGPEFVRDVLAEFPYLRALAVSGAMKHPMEMLARSAGAISTFQKPFTPKDLSATVYAALDPSFSWRGRL